MSTQSAATPSFKRSDPLTQPAATHSAVNRGELFRPIRCVGNWQLSEVAGRGSFTDVFLARPLGCRPNWPADYAIKILHAKHATNPKAIESLVREVEVTSEVSNPHLVTVLDAQVDRAPYYLVMPRLDGVSVAQVLKKVGHLSMRQSLWIARQTAEALKALHDCGWLHGDVKPANIMASASGHATLIDLGFAVRKHEAIMTQERTLCTTLNYVAPEVMTSAYCSDERSDIYSLGIALFEMVTGRLPFIGRSAAELIDAHRGLALPDPRELNPLVRPDLVGLLQRMTAKQPLRRPQNVSELIQEIMPLEMAMVREDAAH